MADPGRIFDVCYTKKPSRNCSREGFYIYNDILFLVALCTAGCILRAEGLGTVVACTAGLSIIHVFHGDGVHTLLHLEDGRVALCTLETFVSMRLAVKYNLACTLAVEFNGLAGRDCESGNRHRERHNYYEGKYEKFLHVCFTSFLI